jgi:lysophospholipase L1-like esterase
MLKTISYNVLVLFVLANVLFWSIPAVNLVSDLIKGKPETGRYEFRSFLGWRNALRETINPNTIDDRKVYFFGGSTMWGIGSPDARSTIPSQFAAATKVRSENYGEIGYTAHQSLVQLLQMLQAGHRPSLVVFYDGVNDVAIKCERGLTPESHGQEREIAALLRGSDSPSSFAYYLKPVMRLAQRVSSQLSKSLSVSPYECDTDPKKAEAIAENLIRDWQFAKMLTESFGGKFIGVLQPVSYLSKTRLDHLNRPAGLDRQYQTVYPLIREKIAKGGQFNDLTSALDVDEKIYIDYNHITPKGNEIVAGKIAEIAKPVLAER